MGMTPPFTLSLPKNPQRHKTAQLKTQNSQLTTHQLPT